MYAKLSHTTQHRTALSIIAHMLSLGKEGVYGYVMTAKHCTSVADVVDNVAVVISFEVQCW